MHLIEPLALYEKVHGHILSHSEFLIAQDMLSSVYYAYTVIEEQIGCYSLYRSSQAHSKPYINVHDDV